jgi:hypothetical protein
MNVSLVVAERLKEADGWSVEKMERKRTLRLRGTAL